MSTTGLEAPPYYDPFDFEIDADPYPTWKRLRDETPLYYNERYDFFALSRFDDVAEAFKDWRTYSSAKGTVLEIIRSEMRVPPGMMIFEDPPVHDYHRGLVSRVFTPKKMSALESKLREFCARSLDPHVGSGRFDFIADLGAQMPMRAIGMLLGIPEQDQNTLRDRVDDSIKLDEGTMPDFRFELESGDLLGQYIDWRADHPTDDLMTELLEAEFEDETGVRRRLTRKEILNFVSLLLLNGSANRDDRKFPHGDTFNIHRTIDQHLAFGYGIHFCLGAALARIEGRIALDEVLKRWPRWDIDWDSAVQARTSTVRGWESLPVFTG